MTTIEHSSSARLKNCDRDARFIESLLDRFSDDRVKFDVDSLARYRASTIGTQPQVVAVVKPLSASEVEYVVKIANDTCTPVYPVSCGRNWGYGSASPPVNGCAILDLSEMKRVLDFDVERGLVTLEPGVTQQDLYNYLVNHNLPFMVPTHGGGPDCSIIGNIVERGYGITPIADHFYALRALEAILPSGQIYRSPVGELGGPSATGNIKWQIGPYLDGIFSQSNFGIVTQATIKLARRHSCVEAFVFQIASDDALTKVVDCVSKVISTISGVGAINLMNRLRVLAMNTKYPSDDLGASTMLSEDVLECLGGKADTAKWTGVGTLYGTRRSVLAAKRDIKEIIGPAVEKMTFVNHKRIQTLERLTRWIPGQSIARLRSKLPSLKDFLDVASGIPSRVALPLAYWLSGKEVDTSLELNPAADKCGLIWYSPLVPMDGESVAAYVAMANEVCRKHGVEPLITLTSLSDDTFDSTLPILFDQSQADRQGAANACYTELFRRGQENGWIPYRIPINQMHLAVDQRTPFWSLVQRIKKCVDPNGIISPGRYCPISKSNE